MSETRTLHSSSLRGVIVPALLVFVAIVWWAGRESLDTSSNEGTPHPSAASPASSQWPRHVDGSVDREDRPPPDSPAVETGAEATFGAYVDGKYRFLEPSADLRAALLAREKVAVGINTARQSRDASVQANVPQQLAQLVELDQKVGTLLRPGDLAAYDVLKDSDVEQWQLDDYAGGISNVAPLGDEERRAILYTKLTHRQHFRQVLADSGLMNGALGVAERQYAFTEVSRALGESRDSYLKEVRQYLYNDEQFTLLSNYENTEYADELEKLRRIAQGQSSPEVAGSEMAE